MEERKILIEVNQQEYQKIISGALEEKQERPNLSQFTTAELIGEIRKRTPEINKHYEEYHDAMTDRLFKSLVGEIKLMVDEGEIVTYTYAITNKEK